jgi:hypothetical protein
MFLVPELHQLVGGLADVLAIGNVPFKRTGGLSMAAK